MISLVRVLRMTREHVNRRGWMLCELWMGLVLEFYAHHYPGASSWCVNLLPGGVALTHSVGWICYPVPDTYNTLGGRMTTVRLGNNIHARGGEVARAIIFSQIFDCTFGHSRRVVRVVHGQNERMVL